MTEHTTNFKPLRDESSGMKSISAGEMASILKGLRYGAESTAQALSANYPLLSAEVLAEILIEPSIYPDLGRDQLIRILGGAGYNTAQVLDAVTPLFPWIELTDTERLKGEIGSERDSRVLSFRSSGKTRWFMTYEQADDDYNRPSGPSVKVTRQSPIQGMGKISIGNHKDKHGRVFIALYSTTRFPVAADLKAQIVHLMAFGLQQAYPPPQAS